MHRTDAAAMVANRSATQRAGTVPTGEPAAEARLRFPGGTITAELFHNPDDAAARPVLSLYTAEPLAADLDAHEVDELLRSLPAFARQLRDLRARLAVAPVVTV